MRCLNKHTPAYMRLLAPEEGGKKVPDQCGYRQPREESWNGENNILQMARSLEVKHRHEEELQLGRRGQTAKQKLPLEKMLKLNHRVRLFKM